MQDTKNLIPLGFSMIEIEIQDILSQKNKIAEAEKALDETCKYTTKKILDILAQKDTLSPYRNFLELPIVTYETRLHDEPTKTGLNLIEVVVKQFIWRSMEEDNRVLPALFFCQIPKTHVWLNLSQEKILYIIRDLSEKTNEQGFKFHLQWRRNNTLCISASYDFKTKHSWID